MTCEKSENEAEQLVNLAIEYLPPVGIDWAKIVRQQIEQLRNIPWNSRFRGVSAEKATAQSCDPMFIAHRACMFGYANGRSVTQNITVSRWWARIRLRLNERENKPFTGAL